MRVDGSHSVETYDYGCGCRHGYGDECGCGQVYRGQFECERLNATNNKPNGIQLKSNSLWYLSWTAFRLSLNVGVIRPSSTLN